MRTSPQRPCEICIRVDCCSVCRVGIRRETYYVGSGFAIFETDTNGHNYLALRRGIGCGHFADWKSTDQVSGATGAVDNYLAYGGYFGLGVRF